MEVDPITGSLTPLDFHHLEEHLPELGKFNLNIDSIYKLDNINKIISNTKNNTSNNTKITNYFSQFGGLIYFIDFGTD